VENLLFRTFVVGFVLGLLGTGALGWFVPAVDLHREQSLTSVQPNGGNVEVFRINLPRDRILVGLPDVNDSIPAGLDWPAAEYAGEIQAELFKVRNRDNTVIGVASRLASSSDAGEFIEWVLHFPARGSIYVQMEMTPSSSGFREGRFRAGTRDFDSMIGTAREQFVVAENGDDAEGRIEIEVSMVGQQEDIE